MPDVPEPLIRLAVLVAIVALIVWDIVRERRAGRQAPPRSLKPSAAAAPVAPRQAHRAR